jgi:hypothetical protein
VPGFLATLPGAGYKALMNPLACALPGFGIGLILLLLSGFGLFPRGLCGEAEFRGQHYQGRGDIEHLKLLETSRRFFAPDPELQNLAMLYEPKWNGLVEGPTWDAWWIQNSYGTTYSILPFLREPFITFLQNSHDLWFDQMGDGKRVGAAPPFDWIAPDGCLCDAARPDWIVYKQGDGHTAIHDWGMEFTAAGLLMQSELLLIRRNAAAFERYLPLLERCAKFIETRRDPKNHLFLAGPAGNLLAPSYAGWLKPDGTYGQAYLTGLSITYIAALDRLIEVEKLAGRAAQANQYAARRDSARRALSRLTTDEGYFIRSLDPDGVRHGVYGAQRHGYFEASPNHDAIAFRVADDWQAERILRKLVSIPGLRPHQFVLPNYPSYDDMYEKPEGLWAFGTWVNGGHWSTCEARMILAYYRLGQFEDARRSLRQLLTFANRFRLDNPLTKCGSDVYQPNQPINLCYDSLGPPAAFMRGLFEYLYRAEQLTLVPHIPPQITELRQMDPVAFGSKRIYLSTYGQGLVRKVKVNGRTWKHFDATSVTLPFQEVPDVARVQIALGEGRIPVGQQAISAGGEPAPKPREAGILASASSLGLPLQALNEFCAQAAASGKVNEYEVAHAQLVLDCVGALNDRLARVAQGTLKPLPPLAEEAARKWYTEAATKAFQGFEAKLRAYDTGSDSAKRELSRLWYRLQNK